jgi:hypothetical protein
MRLSSDDGSTAKGSVCIYRKTGEFYPNTALLLVHARRVTTAVDAGGFAGPRVGSPASAAWRGQDFLDSQRNVWP